MLSKVEHEKCFTPSGPGCLMILLNMNSVYQKHTCFQIVDVDTGKTLGFDEAGEIWVRGPQASHGYLNLPAQTKEMFMNDGWVRTGICI